MPMPEASMDEDDRFPFGQDDVWLPGELPAVKVEAIAVPPQLPSNDQLRLGVLGLDP